MLAWPLAVWLVGPPVAPGCVDPLIDAARRFESPRDELRTQAVRLDRDAHADLAVATLGYCGSGGCDFHLYRIDGKRCARWVGHITGRTIEHAGPPGRRGFYPLKSAWHSGSTQGTEFRWELDASGVYQQTRAERFKAEPRRAGAPRRRAPGEPPPPSP
jgi:hypothetical protein